MKTFKQYITEADTPEIRNAKRVFTKLQTMYSDIPKFPLIFKDLGSRGSGYTETSRLKGSKNIFVNKMVINTKIGSYDPDYTVVHEFAHVVLIHKKNSLKHNKEHDKLTYELAKKFDLV